MAKLGERFEAIEVEGHGKNALDFHIAFYLGERLSRARKTPCAHLYTHFGRKLRESEVDRIVSRLISSKKLAEVAGALIYSL